MMASVCAGRFAANEQPASILEGVCRPSLMPCLATAASLPAAESPGTLPTECCLTRHRGFEPQHSAAPDRVMPQTWLLLALTHA